MGCSVAAVCDLLEIYRYRVLLMYVNHMQCTVSQASPLLAKANCEHLMKTLGKAYANDEITKEALKSKKKEVLEAWQKESKQRDKKEQKEKKGSAAKPTSRRSGGTINKRPAAASHVEEVAKKPSAATAATHGKVGRPAKAEVEEEKEAAETQLDGAAEEEAEEEEKEKAAQVHGVHGAAGECKEGQEEEEEEGSEQVSLNGMWFNIGLLV